MKLIVGIVVALALVASAQAYCKTDADCPGSYCVNYHGPPPYNCHACFDYCCLNNKQCEDKCSTGSYCMIYPGKHYPFYCHGVCNQTGVAEPEPVPTQLPVVEEPVDGAQAANGVKCWMCRKLEPLVAKHDCASSCNSWWPFLQGACTDVCDDLASVLGQRLPCVIKGYCSA